MNTCRYALSAIPMAKPRKSPRMMALRMLCRTSKQTKQRSPAQTYYAHLDVRWNGYESGARSVSSFRKPIRSAWLIVSTWSIAWSKAMHSTPNTMSKTMTARKASLEMPRYVKATTNESRFAPVSGGVATYAWV